MSERYRFTVDRARWLNGHTMHGEDSYLHRTSDGLMCCLGHLAKSCGIDEAAMLNIETVASLAHYTNLPEPLKFLTYRQNGEWRDTTPATCLMHINDDAGLSYETREAHLTTEFALHGIEVVFVGEYA